MKWRAVALGLVFSLLAFSSTAAPEGRSLEVEIRLAPSVDPEEGYRCTAVVRDARSGEVLSAPTIVFLRGQEAEVTSEVPGGAVLRLNVLVSADGSEVSYRAELLAEDQIVTAQSAKIRL